MVSNSASCLSVTQNAALETSSEELSTIVGSPDVLTLLSQIETELYHSEVYRRCLKSLRGMLGEATGNAQMLFKAIGREAIRLSLQQLTQQPANAALADNSPSQPSESLAPAHPPVKTTPSASTPQNWLAVSETASSPNLPASQTIRVAPSNALDIISAKPQKRLSKTELASQKAEQERLECLRHIGEQLRQARQARSLSLVQLHSQTLIPPHQLEALEIGRVEQLPEDIYVRGFIRRISTVLGIDGDSLLASLPKPDPVKSVVPSWYHPPASHSSGIYLNTVHLYLGYSALIAGAVGGLAWLSNQSPPDMGYETEPLAPTDTSAHSAQRPSEGKPGLKTSPSGVVVGPDLAPPEALPNL